MSRSRVATSLGLAALAAALLLPAAPAAAAGAAGPTVTGAWARPSSAENGAAYMKITGHGAADRLVAASVPMTVAMEAQLHRSSMGSDGMMSMKRVKAIPVPAKGSVSLAPGGYHVMLMGLKKPLVGGATFRLTLTFAKAGTKVVRVTVRSA